MRTLCTTLLSAVPLLSVAACGGEDQAAAGDGEEQTFNVLAAASLTEAFTTLEKSFEADNDVVNVEFRFESSTDLAESAADEAPGDVLATADETAMTIAVDAEVTAAEPVTFATNTLVIVTPPDNPAGVASLADLEDATWVRCADDVPCGRVALTLLESQSITAEPASLEPDVKTTLERVSSGEADAGLVYASDAVTAGDSVATIPIEGAEAALTTYFVAPLTQAGDTDLATAWVDLVTSEEGQQALTDAGFTLP